MRRVSALFLAAVVAVLSLTGTASAMTPDVGPAGVPASAASAPVWQTRPCRTEDDSRSCYWDAETAGNGRGHSFYVIRFPGRAHMTCVAYWQPRYAASHDYCVAVRGAK